MMSLFRDRQIRLAMLLLYGLAALCLSLAHVERAFAAPTGLDRAVFCLSEGDGATASGLPDCTLCADAVSAAALPVQDAGPAHLLEATVFSAPVSLNNGLKRVTLPLGSRAPPFLS